LHLLHRQAGEAGRRRPVSCRHCLSVVYLRRAELVQSLG
jgi:hypothetical protein